MLGPTACVADILKGREGGRGHNNGAHCHQERKKHAQERELNLDLTRMTSCSRVLVSITQKTKKALLTFFNKLQSFEDFLFLQLFGFCAKDDIRFLFFFAICISFLSLKKKKINKKRICVFNATLQ